MIDIFTKFPQYCEFVSNFWIHEPLNAITNFGFLIGAYFLYRFVKVNKCNIGLGAILISLMVILGLGSLAWHSYRVVPTLLLDEIPIYIFIIFTFYFLIQSLTRSHKLTLTISFFSALIYYAIFAYVPGVNISNGVLKYVFALLIFLILNVLIVKKFGSGYNFFLPLSIFILAIVFRIVDLYICPIFPVGTHFIWHILIALTMYFGSISILRLNSFESRLNQKKVY